MSQALDDRTESIRMIRDSAGAVAPRGGDTKRVRALRFESPGFDRAVFGEVEKQRDRAARRAPAGDEPGEGLTKAPVYGSEQRPGMNAEQRKAYERMLRERLEPDEGKSRGRSARMRRG